MAEMDASRRRGRSAWAVLVLVIARGVCERCTTGLTRRIAMGITPSDRRLRSPMPLTAPSSDVSSKRVGQALADGRSTFLVRGGWARRDERCSSWRGRERGIGPIRRMCGLIAMRWQREARIALLKEFKAGIRPERNRLISGLSASRIRIPRKLLCTADYILLPGEY
jgi:hypothetical protein